MKESSTTDKSANEPLLITRKAVARLIDLSERQVARLEKEGLIPPPVRLRNSVRYSRTKIEKWIEADCPALAV